MMLVLVWAWMGAAQGFRFSLSPKQLLLEESLAEPGAVPVPLSSEDLNLEVIDWATRSTPEPTPGRFTLTFKDPIGSGSVMVYGASSVQYREGDQWKPLEAKGEKGRLFRLLPLPENAKVQAVRITAPSRQAGRNTEGEIVHRAVLPFATVVPVRLQRASAEASVQVSSTAADGEGQPESLLDGKVDPKRNFSTAEQEMPIDETSPEWIQLQWKKPQPIRGVMTMKGEEDPGLGAHRLEYYDGEGDPLEAGEEEWKLLSGRVSAPGGFRHQQFFVLLQPVTLRALRLTTTGGVRRIGLGEVLVTRDAPAEGKGEE